MDGLLIDSERQMWIPSMAQSALEQGKILTDEFHSRLMGINYRDTVQMLLDEFGEDFNVELFYERTLAINDEIMKNGIPLMKGAIELLEYCKQKGIKTCIGTSTPRKNTLAILKADNILDYFDDIVCGDEVKNGKPNPEIYEKCFGKFNFEKSEAIVFEDASSGAKAAIGAGLRLVLVPDLAYLNDEIKATAFKVIDNLSMIIDTIEEENEGTISV